MTPSTLLNLVTSRQPAAEGEVPSTLLQACPAPRPGVSGGAAGLAAWVVPDVLGRLERARRAWLEEAERVAGSVPRSSSIWHVVASAALWDLFVRTANDRACPPELRARSTVALLSLRCGGGEDHGIGYVERTHVADLESVLPTIGERLYELVRLARQPLVPRYLDALASDLVLVLDELEALPVQAPPASLVATPTAPAPPSAPSDALVDLPLGVDLQEVFLGLNDHLLTSKQLRALFHWQAKTSFERGKRQLRAFVRPVTGMGREFLWPLGKVLQWARNKGKTLELKDLPEEIREDVVSLLDRPPPRGAVTTSADHAIHVGLHVGARGSRGAPSPASADPSKALNDREDNDQVA